MGSVNWVGVGEGVLLVGLWLVGGWSVFRSRPRREYHDRNPRRAQADRATWLMWPVFAAAVLAGFLLPQPRSAAAGFDGWVAGLPAIALISWFLGVTAFTWRAQRAGEPTWSAWKRSFRRASAQRDLAGAAWES